jgi:hypothetical protein
MKHWVKSQRAREDTAPREYIYGEERRRLEMQLGAYISRL